MMQFVKMYIFCLCSKPDVNEFQCNNLETTHIDLILPQYKMRLYSGRKHSGTTPVLSVHTIWLMPSRHFTRKDFNSFNISLKKIVVKI